MTTQSGGIPNIINNIQNSIIKSRILDTTKSYMDKTEQDIFHDILSSIKLHKILNILRLFENKNPKEIVPLLTRNPKIIMDILKSIEFKKLIKVINKQNMNKVLVIIHKYLDIYGIHINIPITTFKEIISLLKELEVNNSPIVNIQLLMTIKTLFQDNIKNFSNGLDDLNNKTIVQLKKIAKKNKIKLESKMNKGQIIKIISKQL